MISYEEALAILHKSETLEKITLPIGEAFGYVAAQDVESNVIVPSFANSAMDGFAIQSSDLTAVSKKNPVTLKIVGSSVAGDMPTIGSGGAWEIMTGAPIPKGYDTVVKVEDVTVEGSKAIFIGPASIKENIRDAGEDFSPGDRVIQSGTMLTSYHVMALATVGKKNIDVCSKPKITVFSTGKELREDTEVPLLPGQIHNSNGPYLMAALSELKTQPHYGGIIADEPNLFKAKVLKMLPDSDIIISTGAVSAGKHDFIPNSLRALGAEILFHKVAIRPGKPMLYARFPDGTHYFGLPGNPVSAAVGLRFFVVPLLHHLQGMHCERPITARLLTPFPKKKGLRFFQKARVSVVTGGKLQLEILQGQESFKVHPLLQANCWASFAEDQDGTEIGEAIGIYPLMPRKWHLENIAWSN